MNPAASQQQCNAFATTTTTTTSSNIMKSELRYVPVAMSTTTAYKCNSNNAQLHFSTAGARTAATDSCSNTVLHVLPTTIQPNAATANGALASAALLPQVAFITNIAHPQSPAVLTTNGQKQSETPAAAGIPINFVVTSGTSASGVPGGVGIVTDPALAPGITVVHTNTPGLAGSILLRNNQLQFNNAILQRAGVGASAIPMLNQEMVKQIVVGSAPRTLLKTQVIQQRPTHPAQGQLLLQQPQQLPLSKTKENINLCISPNLAIKCIESKVDSIVIENPMLTIAQSPPGTTIALSTTGAVTSTPQQNSGRTTFAQAFKSKMMIPVTDGAAPMLAAQQDIKQSDVIIPKPQLSPLIMTNVTASISNTPTTTMTIGKKPEQTLDSENAINVANIVTTTVTEISKSVLQTKLSSTSKLENKLPTLPSNELSFINIKQLPAEKHNKSENKIRKEKQLKPLQLPNKAAEKQQSLLKTKSTLHTIQTDSKSPRAKRSKSVNYPLCQTDAGKEDNNFVERRHSSAAEGTITASNTTKMLVLVNTGKSTSKDQVTRTVTNEQEVLHLIDDAEVITLITEHVKIDAIKAQKVIDLDNCELETLDGTEEKLESSGIIVPEQFILLSKEDDKQGQTEKKEQEEQVENHKMQPEKEESRELADPAEEKQQDEKSDQVEFIKKELKVLDEIMKTEQQIDEQPCKHINARKLTGEEPMEIKVPATEVSGVSLTKNDQIAAQRSINSEIDEGLSLARDCIKLEQLEETDDTNNNKDIKHKILTSSSVAVGNESMDLLCDEQILISSSSATSSSSNSSMLETPPITLPTWTTKKRSAAPSTGAESLSDINSYSSMLDMLSTFNMLNWKERIGSARGTYLRFQLNEFNLLQIHERCPPRYHIHTAYEKPIYEREALPTNKKEQADPLLYLCRRCNCHGPAADFLAPEFCSLECLKRDPRKRTRANNANVMRKHARKEPIIATPPTHSGQVTHSNASILTKKYFRWSTYLSGKYGNIAAPIDLFLNPFPTGPNNFQVGMKLEAIDPENCSLFCVCTIRAIQGYRLQLSFDGYDHMYDFWINADSMDIFPPGWCAKTNRVLQPPKGVEPNKFNWPTYLTKERAAPAHRHLFTHLNSSSLPTRNPFKIGMHLEAEDLNDTGKLCVATVADVLEERIRVHFDGWDNCYDYWVDISSPYIHPCGWHEGRQQLIVPPEFENYSFNWCDYIRQQGSGTAAHEDLFVARDPIEFKPSMKLEVVDPRNPSLIRPATVVGRKAHRIKLHLDCWSNEYCFWMEDDSPDLHPIGWCDATGHDLEPPPGYQMRAVKLPCSIPGCRGIGNAKRFFLNTHPLREACPYAPENWRQKVEKPARVNSDDVVRQAPTMKIASVGLGRTQNNASTHAKYTRLQQQQAQAQAHHYLNEKRLLENVQQFNGSSSRQMEAVGATSTQQTFSPVKQECLDTPPPKQYDIDEGRYMSEQQSSSLTSPESSKANSLNGETTATQLLLEPSLKIAKHFLCDYGPRLRQNFAIWQQNIVFDKAQITQNPLHWSTVETRDFVAQIVNCSTTATCFEREDIDGAALLMLQQCDLTDMLGLKLGPAVKLYSHILQLRTLTVSEFGVELCMALK